MWGHDERGIRRRRCTLACRHFRNVARDAADGILTGEELRSKLAEVERDARGSEDAAIARTARELLATFTSGGDQAASIAAFGDACRALGL